MRIFVETGMICRLKHQHISKFENVPQKNRYARDFKTYEKTQAYGYPFWVDNPQDTTLKHIARELEMYHPK